MRKRGRLVVLLVLAVTVAAVSGMVFGNLCINAQAEDSVAVTLEGDSMVHTSREASIPINWGTVNLGENAKTITITNNENVNLKPQLTLSNLPHGWTLTFSLDDQPISAGSSATGTLTLTVPADTSTGNYNWHASITLN